MGETDDHAHHCRLRRRTAPLRNATLPHPVDLSRWLAAGLIRIDADMSVLRLTDAGRAVAMRAREAVRELANALAREDEPC